MRDEGRGYVRRVGCRGRGSRGALRGRSAAVRCTAPRGCGGTAPRRGDVGRGVPHASQGTA